LDRKIPLSPEADSPMATSDSRNEGLQIHL
jgi:hypothetical protein